MIIRNAQAGDAADIADLLAQLGYPGTEGFVPGKIERLLGHRDAELLVAEDGDRLLGFIGLHFMAQLALPGDFCRITYFCVSDAARGSGWAGRWKRRPRRWRGREAVTASRCTATSAALTRTASITARAMWNRRST